MANFLLLYNGGNMGATEAEQAAVMSAWMAWFGQMGSAVVDGGNPISPVAKTIASNGRVTDASAGVMASGYSVIAADSLDAAVKLAKGCPVLAAGGQVTVYETFNAM